MTPLVSAVIPTFNRVRDVRIAVATALAQTYPAGALEVLVVDDGSTEDVAGALRDEFGDRVRVLRKPNGGVSSARNHGLSAARGDYLALLDSDDEWTPEHVDAQVELLERRRELGMVITDVVLMDEQRVDYDVFRRRRFVPEDGDVLRWVLRNPMLAPASATFRRAVWERTGGFDEALRTAEDLDFHLRVALDWKIGVVERPLTRCMRGHDGLSELERTHGDDLAVIERFVERHRDRISPGDREAALLEAGARAARGYLLRGDLAGALRLAGRSAARARSAEDLRTVARLGALFARRLGVRAARALRLWPASGR